MTLLFLGEEILGVKEDFRIGVDKKDKDYELLTILFHSFVFMQVFNEINCRKLKSSELNVFSGFCNNAIF